MQKQNYSADNQALRSDEGKPQFHLIPMDGLAALGEVYVQGAKKYAPYDWERGMAYSRCYNSLLRHLHAWWGGEERDAETGCHHMAMVTWNAMALLVYRLRGIGIDDRKSAQPEGIGAVVAAQNAEAIKAAFGGIDSDRLQELDKRMEQQTQKASAPGGEAYDGYVRHGGHIYMLPPGWKVSHPMPDRFTVGDVLLICPGQAHVVEKVVDTNPKDVIYSVVLDSLKDIPDAKRVLVRKRGVVAALVKENISRYRCVHCHEDSETGSMTCAKCGA